MDEQHSEPTVEVVILVGICNVHVNFNNVSAARDWQGSKWNKNKRERAGRKVCMRPDQLIATKKGVPAAGRPTRT